LQGLAAFAVVLQHDWLSQATVGQDLPPPTRETFAAWAERAVTKAGFFFEKKKQKTFLNWGTGSETGTDPDEQYQHAYRMTGSAVLRGRKNLLFCEQKRSKKTFVTWVRASENARAPDSKSFLFLFFKKEKPSLPHGTDRSNGQWAHGLV
jgi:hypothetical protein